MSGKTGEQRAVSEQISGLPLEARRFVQYKVLPHEWNIYRGQRWGLPTIRFLEKEAERIAERQTQRNVFNVLRTMSRTGADSPRNIQAMGETGIQAGLAGGIGAVAQARMTAGNRLATLAGLLHRYKGTYEMTGTTMRPWSQQFYDVTAGMGSLIGGIRGRG